MASRWPGCIVLCGVFLSMSSAVALAMAREPYRGFPASEYAARRQQLMQEFPRGIVLLHAKASTLNVDQLLLFGFHQDPTFYYYTGLPNAVSVIAAIDGRKKQTWLFVPKELKGLSNLVRTSLVETGAASAAALKVDHVVEWDRFTAYLDGEIQADPGLTLYVEDVTPSIVTQPPQPTNPPGLAPVDDPQLLWRSSLAQRWPSVPIRSASEQIISMQLVKSPAEIDLMRRVGKASSAALIAGVQTVGPGTPQRMVEAEVVKQCIAAGAEGHSFWPLVASGYHSQYPQLAETLSDYYRSARELRSGDLVHLDIGCEIDLYDGDVGRTVPVSGRFTPEQREVWEMLVRAYRAGLSKVRDGVQRDRVFEAALQSIREARPALQTSLARRAADAVLEKDGTAAWYLHTSGIRDATSSPSVLRTGMVIVFEPYIMVEGQGYYLEDNVLVTQDGHEVLTSGLPYSADEIELAMTRGATSEDKVKGAVQRALDPVPLFEDLRTLTDDIGGRVSGSPAMERAVRWGVEAFRRAGVDVRTESYLMPRTWRGDLARLELVGTSSMSPSIVSVAWGPSTSSRGIEARLVDVAEGSEAEFARAGSSVRGSIVLVGGGVSADWADLYAEYYRAPAIIDRAIKGGAAAILWVGARADRVLHRHSDSLDGEIANIVQAVVAREDGLSIARHLASGSGQERARLTVKNAIGDAVHQENVIAEIAGRELPDEVVILAAHLDSWDLGTGALDNGCNAALVVAAARAIRAAGVQPRRTMRFILFSGEEQGFLGSRAYVQQHHAELDRVRAVVVFDAGSGRVTGYSLGGRDDIRAGVDEVLRPLAPWRVGKHTLDASPGTDNFDFLLEGVPTLVANQDVENYVSTYHSSTDTLDKVDLQNLQVNVTIAVQTALGIADRPEPIGPRQTRAEVEALMKRTGLEEELKAMGYWAQWQSGTRGRSQ